MVLGSMSNVSVPYPRSAAGMGRHLLLSLTRQAFLHQEIFMGSRGRTNAAEIYLSQHNSYSLLAKGSASGSNVVFSPNYHSNWKVVWQNV